MAADQKEGGARLPLALRGIAASALVLAAMTGVARLISLSREIVIAAEFGVGDIVDAYLIALAVPVFFVNAAIVSVGPALIPHLVTIREREGRHAANEFIAQASLIAVWGLVLAALTVAILAPVYMPFLVPGFGAGKLDLAIRFAIFLSPLIVLQGAVAFWTAIANAEGRFAAPAATPAITPLSVVASVLLAGDRLGADALVAGTLIGAMIEAALLALMTRRAGYTLQPRRAGRARLSPLYGGFLALFGGAAILGTIPFADQAMSGAVGPGGIALFVFGARFVSLIAGIGTIALGQSTLPAFARLAASGQGADLWRTVFRTVGAVLVVTVPLTAGIVIFSEPIIDIAFQRGSFTAADTARTAAVQSFYALQIPVYLVWLVGARAIAALSRQGLVLLASAGVAALNLVLNAVLLGPYGVPGIAGATAMSFALMAPFVIAAVWHLSRPSPAA